MSALSTEAIAALESLVARCEFILPMLARTPHNIILHAVERVISAARDTLIEIGASPENTVRVRIAVAVDEKGVWSAAGWAPRSGREKDAADTMARIARNGVEGGPHQLHWIEADVPVPTSETIQGRIVEGER